MEEAEPLWGTVGLLWPGAAISLDVGGGQDRSQWRGARTAVWDSLAWPGPRLSPLGHLWVLWRDT